MALSAVLLLAGCSDAAPLNEASSEIESEMKEKESVPTPDEIETVDGATFKSYIEQVNRLHILLPKYTVLDPKHTTVDASVLKQYMTSKSEFIGDVLETPLNVTVFRQTQMSMAGNNQKLDLIAYPLVVGIDESKFEKVAVNDEITGFFRENLTDDYQQFVFVKKGFTYVVHLSNGYGAYPVEKYKQMAESY